MAKLTEKQTNLIKEMENATSVQEMNSVLAKTYFKEFEGKPFLLKLKDMVSKLYSIQNTECVSDQAKNELIEVRQSCFIVIDGKSKTQKRYSRVLKMPGRLKKLVDKVYKLPITKNIKLISEHIKGMYCGVEKISTKVEEMDSMAYYNDDITLNIAKMYDQKIKQYDKFAKEELVRVAEQEKLIKEISGEVEIPNNDVEKGKV